MPVLPDSTQGGPRITIIDLECEADVPKTGPSKNKRKNKTGCPVSKAVVGTEIKLTAKLA